LKATIVEHVTGVYGFGEFNELVDVVFFSKEPKIIAERIEKLANGEVIDEIITLIKNMKIKDYNNFIFENSNLAKNVSKKLNINVNVVRPSEAGKFFRENIDKIITNVGFVKEEIRDLGHQVSMELTKKRIKKASEKRDLIVVNTIQTIDDLDKMLNLFSNRIREWYGLHFPELDRLIENHETYLSLVVNLRRKTNFNYENLKKNLPEKQAEHVSMLAKISMGAEFSNKDLDQIVVICKSMLGIYDVRKSLEKYLSLTIGEIAPNLSTLAGSLLGARLIALAGGLMNLAKLPSSTVQVLGAEKALFRALKSGTRPPKHGIIFQSSIFNKTKRWQRGKIARALAGKLAIAARVDAFNGKYLGNRLKLDLEKKVENIQKKNKKHH
jgi:nucleolar protein 56